MRIVMKFGGAALNDRDGVRRAAQLVKRHVQRGDEVIVVVSALGGTTDSLLEVMRNIRFAWRNRIEKASEALASTHIDVARSLPHADISKGAELTVAKLVEDFRNVALGISHVGELTGRSTDFLLSFGERLSTPLLAAALEAEGLRAKPLTGGEAGILTDENFGEAEPLMNVTSMQVRQTVEPLIAEGVIPVVAGFIAASQNGVTTTFGRGGSDLTAAILGLALKADELWFWKEVPGIMTADPLLYPGARKIQTISFSEAIEIAQFGARVIHPRALEIGLQSELTYRIKSFLDPDAEGTLIARAKDEAGSGDGAIIRAVSVIDKVYLINISGARLVGTPRVAARVLELLADEDIDVLMISQSSSEANMSIAVPEEDADDAVNVLELALLGSKLVREIASESGYCIVAVVGRGMRGTPGVAAKVFRSMANRGINIRTIAQGSSELNISFMVRRDDMRTAVEALHRDFDLNSDEG